MWMSLKIKLRLEKVNSENCLDVRHVYDSDESPFFLVGLLTQFSKVKSQL